MFMQLVADKEGGGVDDDQWCSWAVMPAMVVHKKLSMVREVEGLEDMFSHLSEDMRKVVHGELYKFASVTQSSLSTCKCNVECQNFVLIMKCGMDINKTSLSIIERYGLHTRKSSIISNSELSQASWNNYLKALNKQTPQLDYSCPDYMLKWELLISVSSGVNLERPYSLKQTEEVVPDQVCLLLMPRGSEDGSVVVGSHIRGSSLQSSATDYVEVDLLLPVTAMYQDFGTPKPSKTKQLTFIFLNKVTYISKIFT
ncbi:hypothetical protein L1987_12308 [Smallanthus sonchifolius]|uniref:Uncharacterized protein n=1 Tax=Smallanthus sonchifolius TaxID=185202 RepID=A0ACB9JDE3_9ASTR|nr:hypothetical protein L1987_12308 [Smallanthus sonchifolius]